MRAVGISARRTQLRNVSGCIPSWSATRLIAPAFVAGSCLASTAIRVARSRSSSPYFLGAAMTLILHGLRASTRPGAIHTAVIAEPADQAGHRTRRGSKGGRPPAFDADRYRDGNVIERSYSAIKQWRGLATRYDKLAITYRAGLLIRAVVMWLQASGDTP